MRFDDPYRMEEFQQNYTPPLSSARNVQGRNRAHVSSLGESPFVVIIAGQSNAANYALSTFVPANEGDIFQVNPFDGAIYKAEEPLLGATGRDASWMIEFADRVLNERDFSSVVLVPVAVGATAVNEWTQNGKYGARIRTGFERCKSIGLSPQCVLWQQGESDQGTSLTEYASAIQDMISFLSEFGHDADWYLGKSTRVAEGQTAPAVRGAVDQLVASSNSIFLGADTDTLGSAYRRTNGHYPHFNDAGRAAAAQLWADAVLITI